MLLTTATLPTGPDDVEGCQAYASSTLVSVAWVRSQLTRGRHLASWFRGVPIDVYGRRWGVLLLDSVDAGPSKKDTQDLSQVAFLLGKLIEGT